MYAAIQRFRERLDAGEVLIGSSVTFTDSSVSELLGGTFDFLWVDMEHSALGFEAVHDHLVAARAADCPTLVRVAGGETAWVKKVIDSGAGGVLLPRAYSVDEVAQFVAACRYPPLGSRGFGPRRAADYGRDGGPDYHQLANDSLFVAMQVETTEALDNLDEIAALPGLDSLAIGPYDLSGALGRLGEMDHPEVLAELARVVAAARGAGIYCGAGSGSDVTYNRRLVEMGFQWVQAGSDYSCVLERGVQIVDELQRSSALRRGAIG